MKLLETKNFYAIQTNDAVVEYSQNVYNEPKPRYVTCFPNSVEMSLELTNNTKELSIKGVQISDLLVIALMNPHNRQLLKKVRDLDFSVYPPYTVPQYYPAILEYISGRKICSLRWGLTYNSIKDNLDKNQPVVICVNYPVGKHCVVINGYNKNNDQEHVIISDPYPYNYPDKNGKNKEYIFYISGNSPCLTFNTLYDKLLCDNWYLEFYNKE